MAWSVEFRETARRQLRKLDRTWQAAILDYLEDEIARLPNPRLRGYRVGDYRLLCDLRDQELIVLVITIAHRGKVYRRGG